MKKPKALPSVPERVSRLTQRQILAWADHHFQRTGRWPSAASGPVLAMPAETWGGLEGSLIRGWRGLGKGSSLALLLAQNGRKRNQSALPSLPIELLLAWAERHYQ